MLNLVGTQDNNRLNPECHCMQATRTENDAVVIQFYSIFKNVHSHDFDNLSGFFSICKLSNSCGSDEGLAKHQFKIQCRG